MNDHLENSEAIETSKENNFQRNVDVLKKNEITQQTVWNVKNKDKK